MQAVVQGNKILKKNSRCEGVAHGAAAKEWRLPNMQVCEKDIERLGRIKLTYENFRVLTESYTRKM